MRLARRPLLGLSSGFGIGKGDGACGSPKLEPSKPFPESTGLNAEESSV